MKYFIHRLMRRKGANAVEYALLGVLLVIVPMILVNSLGTGTAGIMDVVSEEMQGAATE